MFALLSPRQITHAIAEAYALVLELDGNGDHELSNAEVKQKPGRLLSSRLMHFASRAAEDHDALLSEMTAGIIRHHSRHRDEL